MFDPDAIASLKPLMEIAAVPLLSFVVVMFVLQVVARKQEGALPSLFGSSGGAVAAQPAIQTRGDQAYAPREVIRRAA